MHFVRHLILDALIQESDSFFLLILRNISELNPNFFLMGTNLSLKVQARMKDEVRIKNLKSVLAFIEKFGRAVHRDSSNLSFLLGLITNVGVL